LYALTERDDAYLSALAMDRAVQPWPLQMRNEDGSVALAAQYKDFGFAPNSGVWYGSGAAPKVLAAFTERPRCMFDKGHMRQFGIAALLAGRKHDIETLVSICTANTLCQPAHERGDHGLMTRDWARGNRALLHAAQTAMWATDEYRPALAAQIEENLNLMRAYTTQNSNPFGLVYSGGSFAPLDGVCDVALMQHYVLAVVLTQMAQYALPLTDAGKATLTEVAEEICKLPIGVMNHFGAQGTYAIRVGDGGEMPPPVTVQTSKGPLTLFAVADAAYRPMTRWAKDWTEVVQMTAALYAARLSAPPDYKADGFFRFDWSSQPYYWHASRVTNANESISTYQFIRPVLAYARKQKLPGAEQAWAKLNQIPSGVERDCRWAFI
jgi:hypothetical protein